MTKLGIIEGYFGTPWSWDARTAVIVMRASLAWLIVSYKGSATYCAICPVLML